MKVLSLFSGIGAFEKALKNLKIPFELVGFSEIDKYAIKSYCAIHNVDESKNFGDITKINEKELPNDIDLITYGFPCQDISLAGKQKGLFNEDGSQTRSGLFFEALRIIEEKKPKFAIAENVKNLTSKKFNAQFQVVLASLEAAGYNNYWKVLNAKDFGIPQNRERVFIVSIRKDIDNNRFEFPEGFSLELKLMDFLEETVDSKYYIELPFNEYSDHTCRTIKSQYHKNSYANFIKTGDMGATGVEIKIKEATKSGYAIASVGDSINLEQPNSKTRRGRVGKQVAQTLTTSPQQAVIEANNKFLKNKNIDLNIYREMAIASNCELPCAVDEQNVNIRTDGTVGTITTDGSSPKHNNRVLENSLRIRKLTPKECFRLMGFADEDFERAAETNSNTQLYKQAGNSIVVNVVENILKKLFESVNGEL